MLIRIVGIVGMVMLLSAQLSGKASGYNGPCWGDYESSFSVYDKIVKQVLRQQGLILMTTGGRMLIDREQPLHWAFWATDSRKITLEQGRQLAAAVNDAILAQAKQNPAFELAQRNVTKNEPDTGESWRSSVRPDQFGFRIAFWDANMDRPLFPYLAQIRATADGFFFHYANPDTQALQDGILISAEELLGKKASLNSIQLERCHDLIRNPSFPFSLLRSS